jgi:hypothetical protein
MEMRKNILIITFFIIIFLSSPINAYDGSVHMEINRNATNYSKLDLVLKNQLKLIGGINSKLLLRILDGEKIETVADWIRYGGDAEDYGKEGKDDFRSTRAYNHFHDPLEDWGDAGLNNYAVKWFYNQYYSRYPVSTVLWGLNSGQQDFYGNTTGDWSWGKAKESYYIYLTGKDFEGDSVASTEATRNSHFAECIRSLGQTMHLLEDMSSPPHTRNDVHIFPIDKISDIELDKPFGRWTYETHTKKYLKDEGEHKLDFIPNQSGDKPNPHFFEVPVIIQDSDYSNINPVVGLFDRNAYNHSGSIPQNNILGLAEYTNANFFSEDTMWDDQSEYPYPSKGQTNYNDRWWNINNVEQIDAGDGTIDNKIYIIRTDDKTHLAAARYWFEELHNSIGPRLKYGFELDETCWKDYADKLIPRAVGYSAALLDYFFRGEIEISAPEGFLYSIIDGSISPQQLTYIKAKIRNITPNEEMGSGTLIAVAKYKKRTDYEEDLSNDPPTASSREDKFSYSVSLPIEISYLSYEVPDEFMFDFSNDPIPAGITDLYLQVIFKGTLGNEEDIAIAVGMKDLNEPMHICSWNSTDRVYWYSQWKTADKISDEGLPEDLPYDFIIDPDNDLATSSKFYLDTEPAYYHTYNNPLPPGRYSRVIIITDAPSFYLYNTIYSNNPYIAGWKKLEISGLINQNDFYTHNQISEFRGIKANYWHGALIFYPDNVGIYNPPWPSPSDVDPIETAIFP